MKEIRINVPEMLHRIQDDVKRLVKGFSDADVAAYAMGHWVPQADVVQGPGETRILVELPGVPAQDVDVSVSGGAVKVSGEKKQVYEGAEFKAVLAERRSGTFSRSFEIPGNVEAESIHASMKDGLLAIVLPRKAEAQGREIKVEVK